MLRLLNLKIEKGTCSYMEISLKDLSLKFDGDYVFQGIHFSFEKGKFYFLKGDSGCGKSTLLKILVKMQSVESGEVTYSEDSSVIELRRKVQLLPQLPVIFQGTVKENLLAPFELPINADLKPSDDALEKSLKTVFPEGMSLDKEADKLSQGQKQRLALARVLLMKPQVLLCDEPTSALDSSSRQIVDECITKFFEQNPESLVIYISHHDEHFVKSTHVRNLHMTKESLEEAK